MQSRKQTGGDTTGYPRAARYQQGDCDDRYLRANRRNPPTNDNHVLISARDVNHAGGEIRCRDQQERMMEIARAVDDLAHFARLISVIKKRIRIVRGVKPEQTCANREAENDRG